MSDATVDDETIRSLFREAAMTLHLTWMFTAAPLIQACSSLALVSLGGNSRCQLAHVTRWTGLGTIYWHCLFQYEAVGCVDRDRRVGSWQTA